MTAHQNPDSSVSGIAAAIAAPARARMLYCLVDGRPRTSTELAMVANVTPSTASVHLQRLKRQRLVRVVTQGKHRYYSLAGSDVAGTLEALSVLAGGSRKAAASDVPSVLRAARSCYDHLAGILGVTLYDRLIALGWVVASPKRGDDACDLTESGARGSPLWALALPRCGGCAVGSRTRAWTGASDDHIWADRSERRSSMSRCKGNGCSARVTAGR